MSRAFWPGARRPSPSKEQIADYASRFEGVRAYPGRKVSAHRVSGGLADLIKTCATWGPATPRLCAWAYSPSTTKGWSIFSCPARLLQRRGPSLRSHEGGGVRQILVVRRRHHRPPVHRGRHRGRSGQARRLQLFRRLPVTTATPWKWGPTPGCGSTIPNCPRWAKNWPRNTSALRPIPPATWANVSCSPSWAAHLARAEEAYVVVKAVQQWLTEVEPDGDTYTSFEVPQEGEGFAFTEAPRGSLLHYTSIKGGKIDNYQILPATLWNCCPRDDMGNRVPRGTGSHPRGRALKQAAPSTSVDSSGPLTRDWAVPCTCCTLKTIPSPKSSSTPSET